MEVSASRLAEYREELDEIKRQIPIISKQKREARAEGDLRENTEYDIASQELDQALSRKIELERIIEEATVIENDSSNRIGIGSYVRIDPISHPDVGVRVLRVDSSGITVSEDPMKRILSINSKLGNAINNSTSGVYKIQTDRGEMTYSVKKITREEAEEFYGIKNS